MNNDKKEKDTHEQLRRINTLATRLPWIVVIVTLLTAIVTMIEVIFFH